MLPTKQANRELCFQSDHCLCRTDVAVVPQLRCVVPFDDRKWNKKLQVPGENMLIYAIGNLMLISINTNL